jgi:hypothetical protein
LCLPAFISSHKTIKEFPRLNVKEYKGDNQLMRILTPSLFLLLISVCSAGQDCTIIAKANRITPDKLCSPVRATWNVSYTGVNNAGTPVAIEFNWDDGTVERLPAIAMGWGVLIYESWDIYKGWDGYFGNGNLAVQGVYVWKVIGRYADGTYFKKIGDVTFLH